MTFTEKQEDDLVKLRAAAQEIEAAGLTVYVDGQQVDAEQIADPDSSLALRLGIHGRDADRYPVALTLPGRGPRRLDLWNDAVERLSASKLMTRLMSGWAEELPDGDIQVIALVNADSPELFKAFIATMAATAAVNGGAPLATLRYGKSITVSPSTGEDGQQTLLEGARGAARVISASELAGIGAILDEVSDVKPRSHNEQAYDVRVHDARTNAARDAFNRRSTADEVIRTLTEQGWKERDSSTEFIRKFRRKGVYRDVVVATAAVAEKPRKSTDLLDPSVKVFRHFDLLYPDVKLGLEAAEDTAAWLLEQGQVSLEAGVLSARGEIPHIDDGMNSIPLMRSYVHAIERARARHDGQLPLALARTRAGAIEDVITLTAAGEIIRWDKTSVQNLMLAAAQPVTISGTADEPKTRVHHNIPPAIAVGVLQALRNPGALAPVEHLSTEPLVVTDRNGGRVVSEPGYDRAAKAFVNIAQRDRARWASEYHVPEHPTQEQAQEAWKYLRDELMCDFAYADNRARARHLAYLLTCVGRSLTTGSIGFLFNAHDRGTGKSAAALVGRLLGQGNPRATAFEMGKAANKETGFRLASMLEEGGRHFHCDEIERGAAVEGKNLTELITEVDGGMSIRILGTKDHVLRAGVIPSACGNNVELGDDSNRRWLTISLEWTGIGGPLARKGFRHPDLVGFIQENRPQLLSAAHTILLHGLQNEPTHNIPTMSMSHNWPRVILGAMSHLTDDDGKTLDQVALDGWLKEVADSDSLGEQWGELMSHLWRRAQGQSRDAASFRGLARHDGEFVVDLPDALVPSMHALERTAVRSWGVELAKIERTNIPWEGVFYKLIAEAKSTNSKRSKRYRIEASAEGFPIHPAQGKRLNASEARAYIAAEVQKAQTKVQEAA
ncbi:hypothetical protein [Paramicrobacterium agarici]|uniref:hypothetical protein n=1 Tax=Paramicrobacterium agarici TaxID=630514 RepID=UPI0011534D0E|nr:hypothetical protein [Microbacterium agarici]TQO24264.1 hypothetical protein FB385_3144 [Microbacterium agarici]